MVEKIRTMARGYLHRALAPLVSLLAQLQLSPNQISIAGFFLTLISAQVLAMGYPLAAGVLFLLASSFDMFDGALAKLAKKVTPFGAFLDSTLDRLGEGVMFMAIAYRLALEGYTIAVTGVVLAMLGAMLTSYMRARAEALGITCTTGWISRPERVILLGIGLIFDVLIEVVYLLAGLSLLTAGQRFFHVYTHLHHHNHKPRISMD